MALVSYKCPNCGGSVVFDPKKQKFCCEFCMSEFTEEEMKAAALSSTETSGVQDGGDTSGTAGTESQAESGVNAKAGTETGADQISDMAQSGRTGSTDQKEDALVYSCPSCGAELICDASTAATFCPYCGNPTVVPGQFAGTLKPDFVIPFKLSREDAIRELKKHYRGKVFLPKSFSKENHLQEIQGVYVPFWLFSGEAEGNAHYECTRSHKRTEGEYEVIKTEHFDVYRAGTMPFEKVPVDASTKMPDDHMDSIEPYNYEELKPFSTAYLPGFLADKFDVSADKSRERADVRCLGSLKKALQGTVTGYATCFPRGEHADIQRGKVHYALLPVWLLNTKWQGKDFLFAMNGQTGKLVGDLPVDKGRFWGMFAAIAVPLSVLSSVIVLLMR